MHRLEGTFRKDLGHGKDAQYPLLVDLNPPDWLSAVGCLKWEELVRYLGTVPGLLAEADREAMGMYCEAWEDFVAAREIVERDGPMVMSEKGGMYQHPAVGMKNKALERMRLLAREFGMTPSARTSIKGLLPGKEKKGDPFAEVFQLRVTG